MIHAPYAPSRSWSGGTGKSITVLHTCTGGTVVCAVQHSACTVVYHVPVQYRYIQYEHFVCTGTFGSWFITVFFFDQSNTTTVDDDD